jgi:hypothetical protein
MSRPASFNPSVAVLWSSAFIIAAMIIVQAGRLPGNAAYAEMTASHGDYTLLTATSGLGKETDPNDLLYVIDGRDQVLFVYEIENVQRRQIVLRDGRSLEYLFRTARP